jgi:hypothetical protein
MTEVDLDGHALVPDAYSRPACPTASSPTDDTLPVRLIDGLTLPRTTKDQCPAHFVPQPWFHADQAAPTVLIDGRAAPRTAPAPQLLAVTSPAPALVAH